MVKLGKYPTILHYNIFFPLSTQSALPFSIPNSMWGFLFQPSFKVLPTSNFNCSPCLWLIKAKTICQHHVLTSLDVSKSSCLCQAQPCI